MNILFDLSFIRHNIYAGVSKYAYRILDYIVEHKLESSFTLIVNIVSKEFILKKYPQFKYVEVGNKHVLKLPIIRTLWCTYDFHKKVEKSNADGLFCPWANEITMLRHSVRTMSVIHDLQTLIDTDGWRNYIYKTIFKRIVTNSDKIVTISEFSKKQIQSYFDVKVDVLGNTVQTCQEVSPRLIEAPYILYVGRFCKMKNVITLLKAYSKLKDKIEQRLVLVGNKNEYWEETMSPFISQNGISNNVDVIENCSEADLFSLYKYADVFVFPSLREGFGSPPIEAACMCTPVITSMEDSLAEVTMGLLHSLKNPMDDKELAAEIVKVVTTPNDISQLEKIKETYSQNYGIEIVCKRIVDYIVNSSK